MTFGAAEGTSVVWEWHDGSFDRAQFLPDDTGWRVTGRRGDTRYVVTLTPDHACMSLDASSSDQAITLNRTSAGWYETSSGKLIGDASVLDLDLGWSAVTNTFPIRRLMAKRADTGSFDMLMITLPDLTAKVVRQSYTLEPDGWHYENHDSGFTAVLTVDKTGLVTHYPGLCSRKD